MRTRQLAIMIAEMNGNDPTIDTVDGSLWENLRLPPCWRVSAFVGWRVMAAQGDNAADPNGATSAIRFQGFVGALIDGVELPGAVGQTGAPFSVQRVMISTRGGQLDIPAYCPLDGYPLFIKFFSSMKAVTAAGAGTADGQVVVYGVFEIECSE